MYSILAIRARRISLRVGNTHTYTHTSLILNFLPTIPQLVNLALIIFRITLRGNQVTRRVEVGIRVKVEV